jgi:hypothetical protein
MPQPLLVDRRDFEEISGTSNISRHNFDLDGRSCINGTTPLRPITPQPLRRWRTTSEKLLNTIDVRHRLGDFPYFKKIFVVWGTDTWCFACIDCLSQLAFDEYDLFYRSVLSLYRSVEGPNIVAFSVFWGRGRVMTWNLVFFFMIVYLYKVWCLQGALCIDEEHFLALESCQQPILEDRRTTLKKNSAHPKPEISGCDEFRRTVHASWTSSKCRSSLSKKRGLMEGRIPHIAPFLNCWPHNVNLVPTFTNISYICPLL